MLAIVAVVCLLSIQASEGIVYVQPAKLAATDIPNANLKHIVCNNLNGHGLGLCTDALGAAAACTGCVGQANTMRFSQFSDYKGQLMDLVLTAENANYACTNCAENGNPDAATGGNFAKINMAAAAGSQANLKFQVVKTATDTPQIVEYFNVAITDLDGSGTQLDAEQVAVDLSAQEVIWEKNPPGEVLRSGGAGNVFKSTTANVPGDNPTTPLAMTDQQLARTVLIHMQNTDHSTNVLTKNGAGTRSFMVQAEVMWPDPPTEFVTTTTTEMSFGLPWWFWLLLCLLLLCCCCLCCGGGAIPFMTKKKPKQPKAQPSIIEEVITEDDENVPMATVTIPMQQY